MSSLGLSVSAFIQEHSRRRKFYLNVKCFVFACPSYLIKSFSEISNCANSSLFFSEYFLDKFYDRDLTWFLPLTLLHIYNLLPILVCIVDDNSFPMIDKQVLAEFDARTKISTQLQFIYYSVFRYIILVVVKMDRQNIFIVHTRQNKK